MHVNNRLSKLGCVSQCKGNPPNLLSCTFKDYWFKKIFGK
jgi:hypothetical protein